MKLLTIGFDKYLYYLLDKNNVEGKRKRNNFKQKIIKEETNNILLQIQQSSEMFEVFTLTGSLKNNELEINIIPEEMIYMSVYQYETYLQNLRSKIEQIINNYFLQKFGYDYENIQKVVII